MIPDFHLHSSFSDDSDADMKDIMNQAISLGMKEICITDHYDMDFPYLEEAPDMHFDLPTDEYYAYMSKIKEEYKDKIDLKIGIELGFMPSTIEKLNNFTTSHKEFDFYIGSLHIIDNMDPYYPRYFMDKDETTAYYHYFDTILQVAKGFKGYNILGHLDYILRYGPTKADNFNFNDYKDVFYELFKMIIPEGKGIEVNTGGIYKGLGFAHPKLEILRMYKELGGEIITLGSDAHTPNYIGHGFNDVRELLITEGFKYYCTFANQKAKFYSL